MVFTAIDMVGYMKKSMHPHAKNTLHLPRDNSDIDYQIYS